MAAFSSQRQAFSRGEVKLNEKGSRSCRIGRDRRKGRPRERRPIKYPSDYSGCIATAKALMSASHSRANSFATATDVMEDNAPCHIGSCLL
ncbi:hypothetical protein DPEC_G00115580 [Dallia pectoralis]|uniref:Uncharacterized protein n=1 Tax=Dallia pectoralis TaxID=75939 RepID=A0ACC2GUF8_DALPE|nr:hypothetical protein DPEC_G00115580 [Dallia pectoralis]